MISMKLARRGFTIVEISIFLAITGLLFVGITAGVQNSIFQQRYTDAVQSFADFLRSTYDEVLNVQSAEDGTSGTSDSAIYGKVIVFGGDGQPDGSQVVYTYTAIGDVEEKEKANGCEAWFDVYRLLGCLRTDVAINKGIIGSYTPRWSTRIQKTNSLDRFTGTVIIVRHPDSGRVHTAFSKNAIGIGGVDGISLNGLLQLSDDESRFKEDAIDFCVNPNGDEYSSSRADVRIEKGASNASGVEVIMDGDDNECRK